MPKKAIALHLVEKGIYVQNLKPVAGTSDEWFSGNWWVSDRTAISLVGRKLYLHHGQLEPSHSGGEILSYASSRSLSFLNCKRNFLGVLAAHSG